MSEPTPDGQDPSKFVANRGEKKISSRPSSRFAAIRRSRTGKAAAATAAAVALFGVSKIDGGSKHGPLPNRPEHGQRHAPLDNLGETKVKAGEHPPLGDGGANEANMPDQEGAPYGSFYRVIDQSPVTLYAAKINRNSGEVDYSSVQEITGIYDAQRREVAIDKPPHEIIRDAANVMIFDQIGGGQSEIQGLVASYSGEEMYVDVSPLTGRKAPQVGHGGSVERGAPPPDVSDTPLR